MEHVKNNYPEISGIAVFGSSTQRYCHSSSDIDILVIGGRDYNFCPPNNDVYDVIFYENLTEGSRLWREIERDGVIVFRKV